MNERIEMVPIGPIRKNRAQMRTTYDLTKLAELTLQMIQRGFDGDKPLLIRKLDKPEGSTAMTYQYENIRGHRRRMAMLMALDCKGGGEWEIEALRTVWKDLVVQFGGDVSEEVVSAEYVEAAAESLAEAYRDELVPAVIFQGDEKQATLSLISDNFGDEDPDPLGIAHALQVAAQQGINVNEVASHMGQSRYFVENHLALGQVDADIAQRIVRKEMSMSVAPLLMAQAEEVREALTQFILMNPAHLITLAGIKKLTKLFGKVSFTLPLSFPNSTRRNVARAFCNLWHEVYSANPARAWLGAAVVLYNGDLIYPWDDPEYAGKWLRALGVEFSGHWMAAVEPYLREVACATCPIAQLPKEILKVDLVAPGLPCRQGIATEKCMHGLAESDPFHVRVPMAWSSLKPVKREGNVYFVDSFDDLQAAWTAQQKKEAKEAKAEAKEKAPEKPKKKDEAKVTTAAAAPTPAPEIQNKPGDPSPIELMRARIGMYMAHSEQDGRKHFMATPCSTCQHKLAASPTSDPAVPHCAWASHTRSVTFKAISGAGFEQMVVCHQYAPDRPWREIVPEYPAAPALERGWMERQITMWVNDRKSGDYKPFQWLTGRPMSSGERWDDWFLEQFKTQKGELSSGQIFTLFLLVSGEWKQAERWNGDKKFELPVDATFAQMAIVTAEKWGKE
ncbi:MAG: ParB N-terminal domain-containing protein [Anaerolineae bacterium]|nr:ParB N-terminal domain-containing protein [Anaerolineae bacterium]